MSFSPATLQKLSHLNLKQDISNRFIFLSPNRTIINSQKAVTIFAKKHNQIFHINVTQRMIPQET